MALMLRPRVRIAKRQNGCYVYEPILGVSRSVPVAAALMLSLCNGVFSREDILRVATSVYGIEKSTAAQLLDAQSDVFSQVDTGTPSPATDRLDPFDYAYVPKCDGALWRPELPVEISCQITCRCNYRCVYCYNAKACPNDELDVDAWLSVAKQASKMGLVSFSLTGGEPTLSEAFRPMIEALHTYKISPYICTNGSTMTDELAAWLYRQGVECVQVSLDAATSETADALCKTGGSFERAIKAIERLKRAGIDVLVKSVLMPATLDMCIPLIKLLEPMGVAQLRLAPFIPSAVGRGGRDMLIPSYAVEAKRREVLRFIDANDISMHVIPPEGRLSWRDADDCVACGSFKKSLAIMSNGDVRACAQIDGESMPKSLIGNVRDESLAELWNSPRAYAWMNRERAQFCHTCRACEHFDRCHSGCDAAKLYLGQDSSAPDPRCFKAPMSAFKELG